MNEEIYRPGLEGVIAGETMISTIADGLRYRGYPIEQLADHSSFDETAFLILNGELPTKSELEAFSARLVEASPIDDAVIAALRCIPPTTPMMDVMRTGASLLAHFDPEVDDNSAEANLRKAERLLAKMPTVMAAAARLRAGKEPVAPRSDLSLAANLLAMLHDQAPTEKAAKAVDLTLILYAEHEFNASTFTSRVIASTLSDMHSAIVGAIGALKGPLHGGANERVIDVLRDVGSPENATTWVREMLDTKQKIMGFGHRVYKTGDPRAKYLRPVCEQLAEETGNQQLEATAAVIEEMVVTEKRLPPNADWPSARLYYYLGLPNELYTPLFVVSRVVGWSAHVMEQLANNRIIRPRSRYTGSPKRDYAPLDSRG